MIWDNLLLMVSIFGIANAVNLSISSNGGNSSSPIIYGLMFEDINHSGDGGLYAELIQNRAFQGSVPFPSTIDPWVPVGGAVLTLQNTSLPLSSALPTSVNVASNTKNPPPGSTIGLLNPGWWGIDVKPQKYTGSFWVLGSYRGKFTVKLQSNITSQVFASRDIPSAACSGKWVEHKFILEPRTAAPNSNNTFVIEFQAGSGSLNFNLISLFPPTYKNSSNGLRPDLMQLLKNLNPGFLRMPGGSNIQGDQFHHPWRWNETIGPLTQRPGRPGAWNYQNTDGLGLVEYLNWCTDLNVEPILVVWAGLYIGGSDVLPATDLEPWVNDTLNELEFILGPTTSHFGALRASLGYPKPWSVKYVGIGNEDDREGGAASYAAYRFNMFYSAIKKKYPSMNIISSTGDYTAIQPKSAIDVHLYSRPDDFVSRFGWFDHVNRSHPLLIGEYAMVQNNQKGKIGGVEGEPSVPHTPWIGAVSEAVWSIGVERNGDLVFGTSYAPLLQNLNSYQWTPDLISFTADPSQTVLSTSYHVIELLSNARYKATVPVTSSSPSNTTFGPAYYVAGTSGPGKYTFKVAIYNATDPVPFDLTFEGLKKGAKATLTVITAPDPFSANTLDEGVVKEVVEKKSTKVVAGEGGTFAFELENYSVAVLTT